MAKEKKPSQQDELERQELVKKLVIIAIVSDDELMERLVLKGGNAIDLLYHSGARASVDIDFSMENDFSRSEFVVIRRRIEKTLQQTFREEGFEVFDLKMEEKPRGLTADMADFWGGYRVEFKVVTKAKFDQFAENVELLRRHAVLIGKSPTFQIDISKFEYTSGKEAIDLDGYRVFVYTPEMIVSEKLRAICQQLDEYSPIVKRANRAGTSRARDFLDIFTLVNERKVDVESPQSRKLLQHIFRAKRVPLAFLRFISKPEVREFHRLSFPAVVDTVRVGSKLEAFDFYFDFVLGLILKLEPLWDE